MTDPEPIFFYKGRKLDTYTREELIKIAAEGWKMHLDHLDHLESRISSMKLMHDLHEASRRYTYTPGEDMSPEEAARTPR
jgi:hypothetical protein